MAASVVLKASQLCKAFYTPRRVVILDGVDISVQRGETVAIMGRSGQGKTTLLHLLGTLEKPCSGSLEISGQPVTRRTRNQIRNRHLAFVFQSFHLLEDDTVLNNVLMPARIARHDVSPGSAAYRRAMELLERVGLSERINFLAKLLSGGEKQRVALARALCNNPDIIFADEPSGNLDAYTSKTIHALLMEFAAQGDKALVVVTHNAELAALCSTQYQLESGLLHVSKPEEICHE